MVPESLRVRWGQPKSYQTLWGGGGSAKDWMEVIGMGDRLGHAFDLLLSKGYFCQKGLENTAFTNHVNQSFAEIFTFCRKFSKWAVWAAHNFAVPQLQMWRAQLLCSLAFCHSCGAPVDYRWRHFFATKCLEPFELGQGPLGLNAKSNPYTTRMTFLLWLWHQDLSDLFSRFPKKVLLVHFGLS